MLKGPFPEKGWIDAPDRVTGYDNQCGPTQGMCGQSFSSKIDRRKYLVNQKHELERKLANLNEAIAVLESSPEVEKMLDAMATLAKVGITI